MTRTRIAAFGATAVLAACAYNPPAPPKVYDFGPASQNAVIEVSVHVQKMDAPQWLQRTDMLYRLNYRNPQALEAYAFSRWAGTPPDMLTLRIREALGNAAPRDAHCLLQVTLQEFDQIFDTRTDSRAVLQADAVVRESRGDKRSSRKSLRLEQRSATADAAGGAEAFSKLADQLANQLRGWVGGLGYCD